jgi:hypothetical protein
MDLICSSINNEFCLEKDFNEANLFTLAQKAMLTGLKTWKHPNHLIYFYLWQTDPSLYSQVC